MASIGKESLPDFVSGNKAVSIIAVRLTNDPTPIRKYVVVKHNANDFETIIVAPTELMANALQGYRLQTGDKTPPIYVDDVRNIWIRATVASEFQELPASWIGM